MTKEERAQIESNLFKQKPKDVAAELVPKEKIIKVAPVRAFEMFCWWSDYLGCEIEVFQNQNKSYYTTKEPFLNCGFLKQNNIPKNYCEII